MNAFNFWQKWLLGTSIFLVVFGLVLACFPQSHFMDLVFNNRIDPSFWKSGHLPEAVASFQAWIYGVLGSVICGWGIFMIFIAHVPFKERLPWAWNCFAAGVAMWFIFDTTLSAYYHVFFNVGFNIILLVLLALPLAFTRKYFSG
jgi:hypothetical protein